MDKMKSPIILISLVIFMQVLAILTIAFLLAVDNTRPFGFMGIYIIFGHFIMHFVLGLLGTIVTGINIIRAKKVQISSIILLATSVFMFWSMVHPTLTVKVSDAFAPFVVNPRKEELQKQEEADSYITKINDYKLFTAEFSSPQQIKDVNGDLILLTSGKVIRAYETKNYEQFDIYVRNNLIGQKVTVTLPDQQIFTKEYNLPPQGGAFINERTSSFGDIPAYIYYDGELINTKLDVSTPNSPL